MATATMANSMSNPATAPAGNAIETAHEDMIHDAQLDYYGKRLATCSSDRTVRVFNVVDGKASGEGVVLKGHTGPVWQVAWGHPSFGTILASCSYDSRVYVWKEKEPASGGAGYGAGRGTTHGHPAEWEKIKEHAGHSASVNSIAWAPYELGAILACASSDGNVSVLQFKNDGSADGEKFQAHAIGVNAVSWSPANLPGSLSSNGPAAAASAGGKQIATVQGENGMRYQKRLATGGCDPVVRIWSYRDNESKPELEEELHGHTDWVRDVAWAPNIGLPGEYIATASQDRTVLIHYRPNTSTPWSSTPLRPNGADQPPQFPDTVWRVSWSLAGNILAVSCGDGKVTLWKEVLGGGKGWEMVNEMSS